VRSVPSVMGRSFGSVRSMCSIWAHLCNGIIMAEEKNVHKGLRRRPFAKSSTNFMRRPVVEDRPVMPRNYSHVHPSR
jgi:hypothetical protein